MSYQLVITNEGLTKLANANIEGTPLQLTRFGVGDGVTTPNPTMTALANEVFGGDINRIEAENGVITIDLVIPSDVGGWYIREAGIYDNAGDLFAIANVPVTYKVDPQEVAAKSVQIRLKITISDTNLISFVTDETIIYATQAWSLDQLALKLTKDQNLADLPDKATARTNLGADSASNLTSGTLSIDRLTPPLNAIGTLSPAANKMPYYTAANTASLTTVTPFARNLLDDTDSATARSTLGITPATTSTDGFMSAADKIKLNGIATNANNYTHPTFAGDDFNIDTGNLSGATVVSRVDINMTTDTQGHVTDANCAVTTRNLTAADIGAAASSHTHNSTYWYKAESYGWSTGTEPSSFTVSGNGLYEVIVQYTFEGSSWTHVYWIFVSYYQKIRDFHHISTGGTHYLALDKTNNSYQLNLIASSAAVTNEGFLYIRKIQNW